MAVHVTNLLYPDVFREIVAEENLDLVSSGGETLSGQHRWFRIQGIFRVSSTTSLTQFNNVDAGVCVFFETLPAFSVLLVCF